MGALLHSNLEENTMATLNPKDHPEFFDSDGRLLSTDKRQKVRQSEIDAAHHARQLADRQRAAAKTKPRNKYRAHLEEIEREGPGYGPGAKAQHDRRVAMYGQLAAQRDDEIGEEDRKSAIDADPRVTDARAMIARRLKHADDGEQIDLRQADALAAEGLIGEADEILDRVLNSQLDRARTQHTESLRLASAVTKEEGTRNIDVLTIRHNIETRGLESTAQDS